MALSSDTAASLAKDMASKGMGGAVSVGEPSPSPDASPDEAAPPDVLQQIAGDVVDAVKSGNKEEAAKFLVELVERCTAKQSDSGYTEEET